MEKDEFIDDLGIEGEQNYDDNGNLVVTLDEKSWSQAQVILDNASDSSKINEDIESDTYQLEENEESSTISYEQSNLQYSNDYFIINLIGDFEADEYKLVIKDR